MTQEISLRAGVGTSGRPSAPQRQLPPVSAEAARLINGLPHDDADRFGDEFEKLMTAIAAKPSRAGAEVLDYFAAAARNAGRDGAEALTKASAAITASCDSTEAMQSALSRILEGARKAAKEAYNEGFADGHEALRQQLPAVVRETTFISDDKGHITGKTEREYTPGGKK